KVTRWTWIRGHCCTRMAINKAWPSGYTRQGLKPCHRPLIAALAESKLIANYWLRRGDSPCANGAAEFLRQTVTGLPAHIRIKLVRGDAGFGEASVQDMAQALGLKFIFVARLTQKVQSLCRHHDAHWRRTEIPGLEVQEVELGQQFGIKRLCVDNFWGTEAMHHLAVAAYNLCVLLQRRLGQLEKCELNTLRWRLFGRAAVWSRARGKPTLKLAVRGQTHRTWWREILTKLTALPNCNA